MEMVLVAGIIAAAAVGIGAFYYETLTGGNSRVNCAGGCTGCPRGEMGEADFKQDSGK